MWSEDAGPPLPGRLDVNGSLLTLSGGSRHEAVHVDVPFAAIRAVRIGRGTSERLGGRTTVLLDLRDGRTIAVADIAALGALHEVADRLRAAVAT